jgi:ParB family chromosome partitioning protein
MKSKKRALGRGLDAILQSPGTDITSRDISGNYVAGAIANIRVEFIDSNPFQPRTDFEEESLVELAESIRKQGIIQPITIRKMGYDEYQLISGERRLRAAKMAGLEEIPSYIRVANDEQMLEMALVENIHRKDLNAIDIAISYQRLIEECSLTQEMLSDRIGKNRTTISNYIRLLKLPAEIQLALRQERITMGHARAIITIEDPHAQLKVFYRIMEKDLSVRETEQAARNQSIQVKSPSQAGTATLPAGIDTAREQLRQKLQAVVFVRKNTNGKGNIVISFKSEPELERILSILNRS